MPKSSQPANQAAYTLHQRDEAPQGFNTLRELHSALRELPGARAYFEYRWGYRPEPGDLCVDVRVYEASGKRRPDLEDPISPRYCGWPMEDLPWDGDTRPRGEPIEGTGRRTWGNYYRYPRTQQDRRWNQPVIEEGEPTIRGKRRPHIIPSAWDDIPRRHRKNRNWKAFRLTRWR